MKNLDLKRTFNLHKYNIELQRFMSEWKNLLPLFLSVSGIVFGAFMAKGEGKLNNVIYNLVESYLLDNSTDTVYGSLIIYLLIPTLFAVILFFVGLSVYGGLIANIVPFTFGFIIGIIAYYMYSEYTLKGLAYCVIMLFPYSTLVLFSLILVTVECINMSQYILYTISSKRRKMPDYSINKYYINTAKSYVLIIVAAVIKTGIEYLFVGLFSF